MRPIFSIVIKNARPAIFLQIAEPVIFDSVILNIAHNAFIECAVRHNHHARFFLKIAFDFRLNEIFRALANALERFASGRHGIFFWRTEKISVRAVFVHPFGIMLPLPFPKRNFDEPLVFYYWNFRLRFKPVANKASGLKRALKRRAKNFVKMNVAQLLAQFFCRVDSVLVEARVASTLQQAVRVPVGLTMPNNVKFHR